MEKKKKSMKLRTRVIISFFIIILVPIVMCALTFYFFVGYKTKSIGEKYGLANATYRTISNNTLLLNAMTAEEYDEGEKTAKSDTSMLEETDYDSLREKAWKEGTVCHGAYNQHNVLILGKNTAVTNFSHWSFDVQMADLYRFMRKILEKYCWDLHIARKMLSAYNSVRPISESEWQNLRVRFCYPEKYWKLANHYYTHNKAVVSGKNVEKLRTLIHQKKQWEEFSKQCFRQ